MKWLDINHWIRRGEYRFSLLLAALFITLLLPPLIENTRLYGLIWKIGFSGSLLMCVYALGGKKSLLVPALLLFLPTVVTEWLDHLNNSHVLLFYINHFTTIIFLSFIIFHLARYILKRADVSMNVIYASMCIYLLAAFAWAAVYANIQMYYGEAFSFANVDTGQMLNAEIPMSHFVYFSFVTLTTVGYGDITPVHQVAQSWAVAEAIVGQFYLAVVLARLVGIYASAGKNSH